mmetsp:Transcript_62471/g.125150  ORF Transcript_62471/g.125150 Transcript_62471/m.125150 type:complete len:221 (+) Transcript_62471:48-710(+)
MRLDPSRAKEEGEAPARSTHSNTTRTPLPLAGLEVEKHAGVDKDGAEDPPPPRRRRTLSKKLPLLLRLPFPEVPLPPPPSIDTRHRCTPSWCCRRRSSSSSSRLTEGGAADAPINSAADARARKDAHERAEAWTITARAVAKPSAASAYTGGYRVTQRTVHSGLGVEGFGESGGDVLGVGPWSRRRARATQVSNADLPQPTFPTNTTTGKTSSLEEGEGP